MSSRESLEAAEREWEQRAGEQWGRVNRAEAEVKKLRAALERIADLGCIRLLEGHGPGDCSSSPVKCPQCMARAALQEPNRG